MSRELAEFREESQKIKNQQVRVRELTEKVRELEDQLKTKDMEVVQWKHTAAAEADRKLVAEMREREDLLSKARDHGFVACRVHVRFVPSTKRAFSLLRRL